MNTSKRLVWLSLILLSIVLRTNAQENGQPQSSATTPATLVVNKNVVLLSGRVAGLELLNIPQPTKEDNEFCYACAYQLSGLRHIPVLSISGSGPGTYMGMQYPPAPLRQHH